MKISRLGLFSGDNIEIIEPQLINGKKVGGLEIKHPKISRIKRIGEDLYKQYLYILTFSIYDIADELWFDQKLWYEDVDEWELFYSIRNSEMRKDATLVPLMFEKDTTKVAKESKLLHDALVFFTGVRFQFVYDTDLKENVLLGENGSIIDKDRYSQIRDIVREINFIPKKNDLQKAGNKRTKIFMMKQTYRPKERTRKRIEKGLDPIENKPTHDLTSVLSSIMVKSQVGESVMRFPIWRVYEVYKRINALTQYENVMFGYYSGSLNPKNKIDWEDLDWTKILK